MLMDLPSLFWHEYPFAILSVLFYGGMTLGLMTLWTRWARQAAQKPPLSPSPDAWTRAGVQALFVVGWAAMVPGGPLWLFAWAWWYQHVWNSCA